MRSFGLGRLGRRSHHRRGGSASSAFYHDLQCLSGYGDRILDVWAASTVARLHEPEGTLAVRWDRGRRYAGFVGTYATDLFSVAGCEFVKRHPRGAVRLKKRFSRRRQNDRGVVRLRSGARQIILRDGNNWGNSCPDRLHRDLDFYGLDPGLGLDRVVATYRAIARSTAPAANVAHGIPHDIEKRVGIHVRLMDKIVRNEASYDMSTATWRSIEAHGLRCIERCVARGEPLFVCSDDPSYQSTLIRQIRSAGGDVVTARPPLASDLRPGCEALVDFFALSRCARIVQMTKYSTFSIAASLVGDVPLLNLDRGESGLGNRLEIWKSTLRPSSPSSQRCLDL